MHGQVGKNGRMMYEAAQALAEVRRKAVEDALQGSEPSYSG